jgi:predicted TIM-barrel fold metal-dependent hydrolase
MMVLDVNAFIGKWPYWPVPITRPEVIFQKLGDWGIDRACICSTRSLFVNWEDGNLEASHAACERPDSFIPFACLGTFELSHRAANRNHDLAQRRVQGFRGVRLYPQHHSYHPLFEPFIDDICEQAAALRFPVLLSMRTIMNWGVPSLEMSSMFGLVERHPRVPWILSGVNYLHEIRASAAFLKKYETVHLETSCVMGYQAVKKLVEECGHEKILFGSAAPLQHGRASLEKIWNARISDSAREAICCGNARRLLQL